MIDSLNQFKVHGRSVLHIAAEQGFTDIFEFLSDPTYEVDTTLKDKVTFDDCIYFTAAVYLHLATYIKQRIPLK